MSDQRGTPAATTPAVGTGTTPPGGSVERDPTSEVAGRLPITDRPSWFILGGLALLVCAGIAWALFGSAPDAVTGRGMVVPAEGFVEIGTELAGKVASVEVAPGDDVREGTVVARLLSDDGQPITVTSPVDGRIASVLVRAGGVTDRGTALMTLEPDETDLEVVAFVPAGPGKRVVPLMPARVGLASVPRSQYGMIEGRVISVSPVPVSPERVVLIVGGNLSLSEYFLTQGPILEVTVRLTTAPTPSGYKWTTGRGPDTTVTAGTLAEVSVVVSDAPPIQRLLR